ncbi:Pr6Pr family membrane protein [Cellulomonas sp. NPDC089187]|uniref:Pr6Pr family membrane protein n=1 Tax=Cellulomonas sp. NPDC089187 TaxID=3154970 RepID=UPI00341578F5
MTRPALTRLLYGLVGVAALTGVLLELGRALTEHADAERLIRLFSYFTIQSNLLVVLSAALHLWRPTGGGRFQAVVRLDALLCIAVTGVVYHAVLAGLSAELTPSGMIANALLHTVAPLGTVLVWLLVGPRPHWTWATVGWSVVYPLAWVAYTFIRGAAADWYPYPFLDVGELGLALALRNTGFVAVGFLALAVLLRWLEQALPSTTDTTVAG